MTDIKQLIERLREIAKKQMSRGLEIDYESA